MNKIANIWSRPSVRNIGKLLSANIFAQAIGLLIYPLLTRLYTPEDFGLLNLFVSIGGVLALFGTAEYQYAIVLPKEEKDACAIAHVGLLVLACVTGVVALSIPFSQPIASLFKAPELARWWWLMPLLVAGMGLWNILNYWYIRRSAFNRISGYQISQSILSVGGKVGFGMLGWLQGGMILATVLAPLFSLCISVGLVWKKHIRPLFKGDLAEVHMAAYKYANFPKYNLPKSFVNAVGQALPVWLLTPYFGLDTVGKFSLALMVSFLPLSLIARASYQVLFQRVSELVQQHLSIRSVLLRFSLLTGVIVTIGMAIIYFILPQLVTILFGAEWIESATIIRYLYPYLILTPICGSICFLSDVFAKQKVAMWMEVGYVIGIAIALGAGVYLNSFMAAIGAFAWVRFVYLTIQLIWFATLARKYNHSL